MRRSSRLRLRDQRDARAAAVERARHTEEWQPRLEVVLSMCDAPIRSAASRRWAAMHQTTGAGAMFRWPLPKGIDMRCYDLTDRAFSSGFIRELLFGQAQEAHRLRGSPMPRVAILLVRQTHTHRRGRGRGGCGRARHCTVTSVKHQ